VSAPLVVLWRVTERCNLACGFCAYDRRLGGVRAEADPEDVRRFAPILGEYARTRGQPVLFSWIGGEPLLWQPVFALSELLAASGIAVSATTNGTTLGQAEVRRRLLTSFAELTVSVDGFADLHDGLRGWRGGWARLKDAVTALVSERRAAASRLKLRANIVVMRDNLPHFARLCEELAAWGVDEITFNALGGRDRPEFFPAHGLRPEDARLLAALVPPLARRLSARGVTLCAGPAYLERLEAAAQGRPLPVRDCGPGERFLFIDEKKRIAPCHFTSAELGVPLDEVRAAADLAVLAPRFAQARRERLPAVCGDCPSTQVFAKFAS
jgi:MoaA/NifB/PqqE/SkfB family radical SAM enzyme